MNSIHPQELLTRMKILAEQARGHDDGASVSSPVTGKTHSFTEAFQDALQHVNHLEKTAESVQRSYELKEPNVSLVDVMLKTRESEIAMDATVKVRNALVDCYKKIMEMQI